MYPVIELGPVALSTYGLIYALAVTLGGMVALRRLDVLELPRSRTLPAILAVVVGSMLGSILLWRILARIAAAAGRPELFPGEARTVLGLLLFGTPTAWIAFRLAGAPLIRAADRVVVGLPLAQAIGRVGCLMAGCCGGRPTDSWLALELPDQAGHWCPRYPAQLLASGADLGIFVTLLLVDRRFGAARPGEGARLRPGQLTALYFMLYGAKRVAVELVRTNPPVLGPLTWAQLFAVALVVGSLAVWVLLGRRQARP